MARSVFIYFDLCFQYCCDHASIGIFLTFTHYNNETRGQPFYILINRKTQLKLYSKLFYHDRFKVIRLISIAEPCNKLIYSWECKEIQTHCTQWQCHSYKVGTEWNPIFTPKSKTERRQSLTWTRFCLWCNNKSPLKLRNTGCSVLLLCIGEIIARSPNAPTLPYIYT